MEQEKKLSPEEQAAQGNTAQEDGQELGGEELNKAAGGSWLITERPPEPRYQVGESIWVAMSIGRRQAVIEKVERDSFSPYTIRYTILGPGFGRLRVYEDQLYRERFGFAR